MRVRLSREQHAEMLAQRGAEEALVFRRDVEDSA